MSPPPLLTGAIGGQNQVWLSLFLAGAIWLALRSRALASGIALAFSILCVKALGLLAAPAIGVMTRRPLRAAVGFLLPLLIVFGTMGLLKIDFLYPLKFEGQFTTSGNLAYLLDAGAIHHEIIGKASMGLLLLLLAVIYLAALKRGIIDQPLLCTHLLVVIMTLFMIFSRKSYPTYLAIFWFAACICVIAGRISLMNVSLLGFLGLVAAVESSLWFRWLHERSLPDARAAIARGEVTSRHMGMFIAIEVILLLLYVWLLAKSLKQLFAEKKASLDLLEAQASS